MTSHCPPFVRAPETTTPQELKYISHACEERHAYLQRAVDDPSDEYYLAPGVLNRHDAIAKLVEDPDEYLCDISATSPRSR